MERLPLYATATRGTEPFLAEELETLGCKRIRQDRGGVRFFAALDEISRVLVHSRIAMRVLYPLRQFESQGAEGLYEAAHSIPWEDWLSRGSTFSIEATLKDTEHTHSGFVALKLKDGLVDRLREKWGQRPDVDTHNPTFHIVAHLAKTSLSVSLDLSGEPLFKRGYRTATTAAPMKETLAAAMLLASKYDGSEPFVDPMAGSGTLAIEAGFIATRRAPGLKRTFACESWPSFAPKLKPLLEDIRKEAHAMVRPAPAPLLARDYDDEVLTALKRNVVTAGLPALRIESADATTADPPEGPPGLVCTNPPYGERLGTGGQKGMKSFFHKLGTNLKRWDGWRISVLAGNDAFESAFGMRPSSKQALWNGAIACELIHYPARLPKQPR
ncbi:MAG: THUMP domain-containing protein [Myxococcales bacterium]|nr:THUMP domain-containing protein [Myxococcales bacterium]MDP3499199.1 THUMP domain-containing protein [Myxococcales bacterium]